MSLERDLIEISEVPAPKWGKTSHDATLTCPHGSLTVTVFGDARTRRRRAIEMAPALRALHGCRCETAGPVPA